MAEPAAAASGVIDGGTHVYPVRVYYDDTDAAGIVYYANYLRMAERARTEMLRTLGAAPAEIAAAHDVNFAVRRCEIDFLRPARLDDLLDVETRLLELGGASVDAEQIVKRDGADLVRLRIAQMELERGNAEAATEVLGRARLSRLSNANKRAAYRTLADAAADPVAELRWLGALHAEAADEEERAFLDTQLEVLVSRLDEEDLRRAALEIGEQPPAARLHLRLAEFALAKIGRAHV